MRYSLFTDFGNWFRSMLAETWNWFNSLHYEEWFLLLGIIAALGFLCMRGYGSLGRV